MTNDEIPNDERMTKSEIRIHSSTKRLWASSSDMKTYRHYASLLFLAVGLFGFAFDSVAVADEPIRDRRLREPPAADDFTAAGLRRVSRELVARYGSHDRDVPLEVKAAYYEWVLWRYHKMPWGQVLNTVELPRRVGRPPQPVPGSDTATWNGALLAALSYKYAVTKDRRTLGRIGELAAGLRFYSTVTGKPGFYARCVVPAGTTIHSSLREKFGVFPFTVGDGRRFVCLGDPAKGTYNQLASGYAALWMHVLDDLPPKVQQAVRDDISALVMHLVEHDFRLTAPDGQRTTHGDLTPVVAKVGVPFNAQVSYQILALGHSVGSEDKTQRGRIDHQFHRLRHKHHAYYEDPHKLLVRPQRVGAHPLVKGMNDRNHVTCAAYTGLMLELEQSRRTAKPVDGRFMFRLGRTMYWSMKRIGGERNALCNFMWAGMLSDPERMKRMIRTDERPHVRRQIERGVADGVEQLRRFPIDRFNQQGRKMKSKKMQWVDGYAPDDFYWKVGPYQRFKPTGPATDRTRCAIDYLAAYWLFRYWKLDDGSTTKETKETKGYTIEEK